MNTAGGGLCNIAPLEHRNIVVWRGGSVDFRGFFLNGKDLHWIKVNRFLVVFWSQKYKEVNWILSLLVGCTHCGEHLDRTVWAPEAAYWKEVEEVGVLPADTPVWPPVWAPAGRTGGARCHTAVWALWRSCCPLSQRCRKFWQFDTFSSSVANHN